MKGTRFSADGRSGVWGHPSGRTVKVSVPEPMICSRSNDFVLEHGGP